MGNGPSADGRRQHAHIVIQGPPQNYTPPNYSQPNPYPHQPHYPPPAYLTYGPNGVQPQAPQQQQHHQLPYSSPARYPAPPQQPSNVPPRPIQTQECQTTATVKNQVNLKKPTLAVRPLPESPQTLTFTFQFDASAACRVCAFVNAKEDTKRNCLITTSAPVGPAVYYGMGMKHNFPDPSSGPARYTINLTQIPIRDLITPVSDSYPLLIRLEALTDKGRVEGMDLHSLEVGCALPAWVQSQTTYAKLTKEDDGSWGVRVLKQKIWVEGQSYELQEIYGMEQDKGGQQGGEGAFDDLDGNDCVICMGAPRDTTALPCRHMCMCNGCASALKAQTNKCPICRNEIESLLHIKMAKGDHRTSTSNTATGPAGSGR